MKAFAFALLLPLAAGCGGETTTEQLTTDATVTPSRAVDHTRPSDDATAPDAPHADARQRSAPPDSGRSAPPDSGPADATPLDTGASADATAGDVRVGARSDSGASDAGMDAGRAPDAGPITCPDAGCGAGQICYLPCMLCEAALLCGPADDGGVCPPGYEPDDECTPGFGCRQVCPPPTCVAASPTLNCSPYQGGADYCVEPCE